jgi:hypothetical protein
MSSPATRHQSPVIPSDEEVLSVVGRQSRLWRVAGSGLRVAGEEEAVTGRELLVASENTSAAGASGLVTSHSPLVTPTSDHAARDEDLRDGEFYAVRDVSFELRRGELRNPGRSEKEISKKCLGATKVPASR